MSFMKWFWSIVLAGLVAVVVLVAAVSPQTAALTLKRIEAILVAVPEAGSALASLSDDRAQVAQGESVVIDVLANDDTLGSDRRLLVMGEPNIGTVSVQDGKAVYTAPAGFQGNVRFTYLAKGRLPGPPGRATVDVAVGSRFRIEGSVFRVRADAVRVTLRIGGREYATVTDAERRYAIDALAFDDSDIAVLAADGVEADSKLHLESFVGSYGRIKRRMGADGVLTREEDQAVVINFVSAMFMIHAVASNDGQLPSTDALYEAAVINSSQNSVLESADFLRRVDAGQFKLTGWSSTGYAFVSRPGAIWTYQRDEEEMQYGFFSVDAAREPEQAVIPTAADFAQPLTFLREAAGGVPLDSIRTVLLSQPLADGTFDFVDGVARPVVPLAMSLNEPGKAVFTPTTAQKHIVREINVRLNGVLTKELQVLTRRELIKIFDGELADLYLQWDVVRTEFPSFPERNYDGVAVGRTWVAYRQLPQQPYTSEDVPARMAMAYFCPRDTLLTKVGYCDYQVHRFAPGGNGVIETAGPSLDGAGNPRMRALGGDIAWSIDAEGRLVTSRADTTMTHQRVAQENDVAEGIVSVGSARIGGETLRIAHYYQAVRVLSDGAATPVPAMSGDWDTSFMRVSPFEISRPPLQTYRFSDNATGFERGADLGESYYIGRFAWSTDAEGLLLRRYLIVSETPEGLVLSENACPAPSGNCRVRFQRWIPLAYANGKAYFQEEVYDATSFPALPLTRSAVRPTALYRR